MRDLVSTRSHLPHATLAAVVIGLITTGCPKSKEQAPAVPPGAPPAMAKAPGQPPGPIDTPKTQADMKAGVDALYTARDPDRAATIFGNVLKDVPGHYGATYQLAASLAAAGRFDEAKPVWQSVLPLAARYHDSASLAEATKQLRSPGPAFPEGLMARGLEALYKKADPRSAVAYFKSVLAAMPTHYGATYQLAVALERAGQPDEARAQWAKVLASSTAIHDEPTARTATARLADTKGGPTVVPAVAPAPAPAKGG